MRNLFFKLIADMSRSTTVLLMLLFVCNVYSQQRFLSNHPRLLFTGAEETAVKQLIQNDPLAGELAEFLKAKADTLTITPQKPYLKDKYGNILWTSRAYVNRLGTLALAYRIYGERKYLDAANEALLWVCNYPDWDPSHYLDTAEMATAVAIAYDWLYDTLPASTKELVKKCLYERAIVRVLREYEKGGSGSWAKRETNWNVVCNTGMVIAALGIAEDYPKETAVILDNAAKYMPNCLKHFAPDGVCYEGPAYWQYTASYLALYLKAVADNDNGKGDIAQLPGLERTALYQKRTLTPSGRLFNFGNAGADAQNSPAFFLFSRMYSQPEVAEWYREKLKLTLQDNLLLHQLFFLSLPWFDNASPEKAEKMPALEIYHNTINDIIVFNGNRKKKGSLFLIAKGGEPRQAHQHLDGGTFIVESNGVCWTEDLGSDDYSLPGFWDGRPDGQRWKYFRNNNLSHNTLSIDHKIQYANGEAFVCEEHPEAKQPSAKLDMTTLYKDQASSVFRTFKLLNDYTIEITDEVELLSPQSIISWISSTKAQVEVEGNRVHLTRDGKHFYMEIIAPVGAVFKTYPAKNTYKGEYPIEGYNMLEATCGLDGGKGKIVVRMSSKRKMK
jgi:hypothetical protein